ncbi:bone morphogenetic protein 3-like [Centruroides vittatus]|uniref:bone morphogenetic protein 3-like n=1 Tax=Centruroides vittatus TaxID=120091 RepID=UPI00350F0119
MNLYDYILFITAIAVVTVAGQSHASKLIYQKSKVSSTPRYMVQLYEKYKSGRIDSIHENSSIVRSILPMKGKLEDVEMLVYNLTGVPSSEVIIRAELHAFIRRRKSREHVYRFKLWDLIQTSLPSVEQREIKENDVGWSVYEVTKVILNCRTPNTDSQHLLGISIEASSDRRKFRSIPMKRLVSFHSQPFLLLFSYEKTATNFSNSDIVQDRLNELLTKTIDENKRRKRSIHDNELPEYPLYKIHGLQLVSSSGSYGKDSVHRSRLLPRPQHLNNRKSRGKKRERKRKHRKLPIPWKKSDNIYQNEATIADDDIKNVMMCQKKKLIVDFAALGWTNWIISPATFEANYCAGQCLFPLPKNLFPSNHATIQSLVHSLSLDPNVPPPCCVPDMTSSVTLLYYDEDTNVVLKRYPRMTVDSCACR